MSEILGLLFFILSITFSSEKAMAPHSSTLSWKLPWTEEPGRLQSMGSQRVGHGTRLNDFTFQFHALEKAMAPHSSVLAWRIPGTEEPGGLPSMGSHRVGHDWRDLAAAATFSLPFISLCHWYCLNQLLSSLRRQLTFLIVHYYILIVWHSPWLCVWNINTK